MTDRLSKRSFRHLLQHGHIDCLVAERLANGNAAPSPIGYSMIFYRRTLTSARLHSLAIDPSARGHGAGRALLDACEQGARRHGTKALRLAVRQDNQPAIRLYRASGYRETGTLGDYYRDGMTAISMEKSLAG